MANGFIGKYKHVLWGNIIIIFCGKILYPKKKYRLWGYFFTIVKSCFYSPSTSNGSFGFKIILNPCQYSISQKKTEDIRETTIGFDVKGR